MSIALPKDFVTFAQGRKGTYGEFNLAAAAYLETFEENEQARAAVEGIEAADSGLQEDLEAVAKLEAALVAAKLRVANRREVLAEASKREYTKREKTGEELKAAEERLSKIITIARLRGYEWAEKPSELPVDSPGLREHLGLEGDDIVFISCRRAALKVVDAAAFVSWLGPHRLHMVKISATLGNSTFATTRQTVEDYITKAAFDGHGNPPPGIEYQPDVLVSKKESALRGSKLHVKKADGNE